MRRVVTVAVVAMMAALLTVKSLSARELREGIVVTAGNGGLAFTDIYGENMRSYSVSPNVRIMLNGLPARLEELRMGDHVLVTTRYQDRRTEVVMRVDGHRG